MESKLDHNILGVTPAGKVMLSVFAWEFAMQILSADNSKVEDLRLMVGDVEVITEQGFRGFLTRLSNLPFDDSKLTDAHRANMSLIKAYLETTPDYEEPPVDVSDSKPIGQVIEEALAESEA